VADIERSWLTNPSRRMALARMAGLMAGSPIAAAVAQIDPKPLEASLANAKANLATAQARLDKTNTDVNRLTPLAKQQAVSQQELDNALSFQDAARAQVDAQKAAVDTATLDLGYTRITAPIDGQVLQCKVRPGEYAKAGVLAQALILMGDVRRLHVRADIDEKDAWRVQPGVKAIASVRGNATKRYPLEYVRLEPYVVPKRNLTGDATERVDTRVLQAIYRLPVGVTLHPGQQMDLSIETGQGGR